MSTNQMSSTPTPSVPDARPRDVRTFWRVLLAVLAPLPMVGLGAYYLLSPIDGSILKEPIDTLRALLHGGRGCQGTVW